MILPGCLPYSFMVSGGSILLLFLLTSKEVDYVKLWVPYYYLQDNVEVAKGCVPNPEHNDKPILASNCILHYPDANSEDKQKQAMQAIPFYGKGNFPVVKEVVWKFQIYQWEQLCEGDPAVCSCHYDWVNAPMSQCNDSSGVDQPNKGALPKDYFSGIFRRPIEEARLAADDPSPIDSWRFAEDISEIYDAVNAAEFGNENPDIFKSDKASTATFNNTGHEPQVLTWEMLKVVSQSKLVAENKKDDPKDEGPFIGDVSLKYTLAGDAKISFLAKQTHVNGEFQVALLRTCTFEEDSIWLNVFEQHCESFKTPKKGNVLLQEFLKEKEASVTTDPPWAYRIMVPLVIFFLLACVGCVIQETDWCCILITAAIVALSLSSFPIAIGYHLIHPWIADIIFIIAILLISVSVICCWREHNDNHEIKQLTRQMSALKQARTAELARRTHSGLSDKSQRSTELAQTSRAASSSSAAWQGAVN